MMRYISYLMVLCIGFLAVGCADEPAPLFWNEDGGGDVTLSLKVSIGNSSSLGGTRTEPFQPTEDPYELIHTLRIIITREDNTVEFNRMVNMPKGVGLREIGQLEFKVSTSLGEIVRDDNDILTRSENKHIYLVANEASLPNEHVRKMLKDLKEGYYKKIENTVKPDEGSLNAEYTEINNVYVPGEIFLPSAASDIVIYNEWTEPDETIKDTFAVPMVDNDNEADKKFVPMTEFFDISVTSNLTDPNAKNVQEKELFITRNLVKFEFEMDATEETGSFKVTEITISSLMQKEYLFPHNTTYKPGKYNSDGVVNTEDKEIIDYSTPGFEGNSIRPYMFKPENLGYNSKKIGAAPTAYSPSYNPGLYFCESKTLVAQDGEEGENTKLSLFSVSIGVEFDKYDTTKPILDNEGNPVLDEEGQPTYEKLRMEFDAKNLDLPDMLPRNTIVRVKMTLKNAEDLSAEVVLVPYLGVSLNPWFGFD
ncbi:MAG: hypothetical protein K2K98_09145 [Muribaculaceae bacterium]|nr:hypothetical protein [Muribaculaceae bacterium]